MSFLIQNLHQTFESRLGKLSQATEPESLLLFIDPFNSEFVEGYHYSLHSGATLSLFNLGKIEDCFEEALQQLRDWAEYNESEGALVDLGCDRSNCLAYYCSGGDFGGEETIDRLCAVASNGSSVWQIGYVMIEPNDVSDNERALIIDALDDLFAEKLTE